MSVTAKRRILLTGASGTLGRNFLELVGNDPSFQILVLLRKESREVVGWSSVEECRLEVLDRHSISTVVKKFQPDTIIHAAATGMEFPKTEWFDLIRFNVDFTVSLCEAAARSGTSHFVFISTGLGYRSLKRPLNETDALETLHPYGASKAAADMLVRSAAVEFGLPLTVLRPFSFTGLGDDRNRLFPSILRTAVSGVPMNLTSGVQVRDHISARDVARGIVLAMGNVPEVSAPRVCNLGGGSSSTVRDIVESVVSELGIPVELCFGTKPSGRFDPPYLVADHSKAGNELGWYPVHRLAHAVWELSKESFPDLNLAEPIELI
jgi:GDP-4-dehydro-6-deoxy-D-mannose reductase